MVEKNWLNGWIFMHDQIVQLKTLQEKIISTWGLLKIDEMKAEMHGLEKKMLESDFWADPEEAKKTSQRYNELKEEVETWTKMKQEVDDLLHLCTELESQPDEDMKQEVIKRITELEKEFTKLEFYILFDGKNDKKNAIVSIHAGSGGTEAQDWAEMLLRMVMRYAEKKHWTVTILDEAKGAEAGIKLATLRIEGRYVYGYLQSEHGTHRLVRISPFDAEKMRHTSFALIEVIPEVEVAEMVEIDPKELRIDTFMSGGKGGQSVNTTYSAVRIVHLPTGTTVQCQNERSQLQNKETAMKILHSKLIKLQEEKEEEEHLKLRGEYKSPEWGSQIRSYVLHPYHMVKDLRSRYETADTDAVLNGELEPLVEAFLKWKKQSN